MIVHILQMLLLLGITALLVWVSLRYKIKQLEQSASESAQNLIKTRSKYNYLLSQNNKYESETKGFEHQMNNLQQQQINLQSKLSEAQHDITIQQAKIEYLETYKSKVEEQNEKIRTAEWQLQDERANLRRLEFELNNIQNELTEKNKLLANQTHETSNNSQLLNELNKFRKETELLSLQQQELEGKLQQTETERKQLYSKVHEISLQLTAQQLTADGLSQYKKRYEELTPMYEQQKGEIELLRKRNLQLIEKQQQLEEQLKQYRELNRDYKNIITALGYDKESFSTALTK